MSAKSFNIYSTKKRFGQITIIRDINKIQVKMYNTVIVTKELGCGTVTLNSGGWQTATTKTAMNVALKQMFFNNNVPYVFQKKGNWYIDVNGVTYDYQDGIKL